MSKVCLQTLRNNRKYIKNHPILYKIYKLHGKITREFSRLRMQNFQAFVFTSTQTCREIFDSALVHLNIINVVAFYSYLWSQICFFRFQYNSSFSSFSSTS